MRSAVETRCGPSASTSSPNEIVALGTAADLKQQTGTDSLEQAFLKLTGTTIRDEAATGADQMRAMAAMWRGKR